MCKATSMIVISFFEGALRVTAVYLFNISFIFTIVRSTTIYLYFIGGSRGVMVVVVGNGHGDTSSNPGRD